MWRANPTVSISMMTTSFWSPTIFERGPLLVIYRIVVVEGRGAGPRENNERLSVLRRPEETIEGKQVYQHAKLRVAGVPYLISKTGVYRMLAHTKGNVLKIDRLLFARLLIPAELIRYDVFTPPLQLSLACANRRYMTTSDMLCFMKEIGGMYDTFFTCAALQQI
jgi:hypothetical protein